MRRRVLRIGSPLFLILLLLCGCQSGLFTIIYLFKGKDEAPPYTFLVKGEQKVAVVCRSMVANQLAAQNAPRDIARQVGDIIHTKTKNKKLKVVESTRIDAWLDNCDNVFDDFLEVGRAKSIAADYVIGIELIGFQLRDSHSPHLLQGKAYLQVRAIDCESGEVVANRPINVVYPPNVPMTAGPGVDQAFRAQFIRVISEQIAILFIHHDPNKTKPIDADTLELHRL